MRKEFLHRFYTIVAMLAIAYCGSNAMIANDGDELLSNLIFIYAGTFLTLFPGLIIFFIDRTHNKPIVLKWLSILIIWMFVVATANSQYNIFGTIVRSTMTILPLATLATTYAYSCQYGIHKHIHWAAVGMLVIFIARYVSIYNFANMTGEAHLITSYYPLFLLPLVLMHPSKVIRYASILIVTITVFSSIKRGGVIALSLGLLVYILCYRKNTSNGIKALFSSFITLGVLGSIFYYLATSDLGGVVERIMSIQEDGGSGRTYVWETTWNMISQSETLPYICGHGENAVVNESPLFLSAHNDFLETLYDYGLIGFLLYCGSMLSLFLYTKKHIQKKTSTAPSMAMLFTLMIVLTNISHVLIYFFMTLCCMTIGLLVGQDQYDERNQ